MNYKIGNFILLHLHVLTSPIYEEMLTIQTDASDVEIGAVLTQGEDCYEHVIAYMSKKFTSTQNKYPATERECLAALKAINKFRSYAEATHFRVLIIRWSDWYFWKWWWEWSSVFRIAW